MRCQYTENQNRKHKDIIKVNPYLLGAKPNKLDTKALCKNEAQDGAVTATL